MITMTIRINPTRVTVTDENGRELVSLSPAPNMALLDRVQTGVEQAIRFPSVTKAILKKGGLDG